VQNLSGRNSNGTHLSEPKYLLKHHAYAVKQPDKAPMAANTGRMTSILTVGRGTYGDIVKELKIVK